MQENKSKAESPKQGNSALLLSIFNLQPAKEVLRFCLFGLEAGDFFVPGGDKPHLARASQGYEKVAGWIPNFP